MSICFVTLLTRVHIQDHSLENFGVKIIAVMWGRVKTPNVVSSFILTEGTRQHALTLAGKPIRAI